MCIYFNENTMYDLPKSACIRFDGEQLSTFDAFLLTIRTTSSFNKNSYLFKALNSNLINKHKMTLKECYAYFKDIGFIINDLYYINNYYYEDIGGVLKGICNLDGTFNSFNLVKYPTYEEVKKELELICSNFPTLDFKATIYDSCITNDLKQPVFSFHLNEGKLQDISDHLLPLSYVHTDYEHLNYSHLEFFSKLLFKDNFNIFNKELVKEILHEKRLYSLYTFL